MLRQLYNPALLSSLFYACLIFASMHDPGLLFAAIGQVIVCACVCALLMLLVGYRDEICELAKSALQLRARLFSSLAPTEEAWPSESDLTPPDEPSLVSLFQRPPPSLA
jgi:hypothetical protein